MKEYCVEACMNVLGFPAPGIVRGPVILVLESRLQLLSEGTSCVEQMSSLKLMISEKNSH